MLKLPLTPEEAKNKVIERNLKKKQDRIEDAFEYSCRYLNRIIENDYKEGEILTVNFYFSQSNFYYDHANEINWFYLFDYNEIDEVLNQLIKTYNDRNWKTKIEIKSLCHSVKLINKIKDLCNLPYDKKYEKYYEFSIME